MFKTRILPLGLLALLSIGLISYTFTENNQYADAAANYKKYCVSCHGENLQSFVDRKWIYGNSWNEVYKAIKVGYPNDGMPAYDTAFTDQEISDLTDYIVKGIERVVADQLDESDDFSGTIESEELDFRVETVVDDLKIPWGIDFLPSGEMLITERNGTLYLRDKNKKLKEIRGVPKVKSKGQGGLLDVTVHPDFKRNQWVYLSFSKPNPDDSNTSTTAVVRGKLKGNALTSVEEVFEAQPYLPTNHHYGSRVEFDKKGFMFITVGDRGRRDDNPQSLDNHCGKVHRLHDDGRIPKDNPFVNQKGAMASIYSYGHRNPQGIAVHPGTGEMWEHEHGPRGGDEVNRIQAGKNYGWPVISYGINYNGTQFTDETAKANMIQPETYYVPSIAPCGADFVSGDRYPAWKNNFLVGSLRFDYIDRCVIKDNKIVHQERLLKNIGRMRDIQMGPDGYIYFSVEDPGKVMRIVPE
jgi:glucose/arabinose dehydrogenase